MDRVLSARLISLQERSPDKSGSPAGGKVGIKDEELKELKVPNPRLSLKDPTKPNELIKLSKVQLLLEFVEYYYRGLGSSLYKTCLQAALMYMAKDQIALATKTLIVSAAGLTAGGEQARHKLVGAGGRPVR